MPRLLEINVASNRGSTGRIAERVGKLAISKGWEAFFAHGIRYAGKTELNDIPIGSLCSERLHFCRSLLFDAHGCGSKEPTLRFVERLGEIQPDVIHLHNIHGYYINYKFLFKALRELDVPIVWTFHDCWGFTGHCTYFDRAGCNKWKSMCTRCPQIASFPRSLIDQSKRNFYLKKDVFTSIKKLTVVPVSNWLSNVVSQSFLKDYPRIVIHNGVDLSVFSPKDSHLKSVLGIQNKKMVLGVADGFGERKGLLDFITLQKILPPDYQIVLIGTSESDRRKIPDGIIAYSRTNNQFELAEFYSAADVYVNPTYEDNFPTTNIEALACDTPVVTYNTGGSPEAIDEETGCVVERGNIIQLRNCVVEMCERTDGFALSPCRTRAEVLFDNSKCFNPYLDLFTSLL